MEMWPHDSLTLMLAGCESRDDERGSTFSLFTVLTEAFQRVKDRGEDQMILTLTTRCPGSGEYNVAEARPILN